MPGRVQFGVYELDCDGLELRKHGIPIRLQEQPLLVLTTLVERPGQIVTRDHLQERIWGKDTFVDFDQSLNKAVNRLREALNDDPAQPRYIETVPRRGYRFVAPVTQTLPVNGAGAQGQFNQGPSAEPRPEPTNRSSRVAIVVAASLAAALVGVVAWAFLSPNRSAQPTLQESRHMSSFGFMPVISPDGRLLAYAAAVDGGTPHIWVQQTSGGVATQLTSGPDFDVAPDFSPDGTQIVFYSHRNGGGIYLVPSLPGEARLVVAGYKTAGPRFSPSGTDILYWMDYGAFTVSLDNGQPVALPINRQFRVYAPPFWSPDGKEILFYGVRKEQQTQAPEWWIASVAEGSVRLAHLPEIEQNFSPVDAVRGWVRTSDGLDCIIYSTATADVWKLWRVALSPRRGLAQERELLTSGAGTLGSGGAISADGKLVWGLWRLNHSIYQIPTDERGQKIGPIQQLPLAQGASHRSPSVSHDGKWMAYDSSVTGKPNAILLRNLNAGTDHLLDDKGRSSVDGGDVSISPDGSKVAFTRDCKQERWPGDPALPYPCSFLLGTANGTPEPVCNHCTPRGFSADGSAILFQKYHDSDPSKDRIVVMDLRTRTERDFLADPQEPLFHAFFSWDGRWVVFKKLKSVQLGYLSPAQILIAPVRHGVAAPKSEWIVVTDGQHADDKPQFSPDGNTVYFTSTRDGYLCIWAQRVNPVTKHPIGAPFPVEHFHNSAGRAAPVFQTWMCDLSIAKDKILINLPDMQSDLWMTGTK